MIKLIAVDLDATLLQDDLKISEKTKIIIRKAAAMGIYVIIATGRTYKAASLYDKDLSINHPMFAHNGAIVKEPSGNLTYFKPISIELSKDFVRYSNKNGYVCSIFYGDNEVYMNREDSYSRDLHVNLNKTEPQVCSDLENHITQPTTKLLITDMDSDRVTKINRDLLKRYGESLNVARSGNWYIDVMGLGVSKGEALKYLAGMLNISRENILAIGDSRNDLEMLKFAKIAVAMGNAEDVIKENADFITENNNNEGVYKAIYKFLWEENGYKL